MTGDRYAIIRYRPAQPQVNGTDTLGWETLSSVMFVSPELAYEFADKLDHASVFRLVPEPRPSDVGPPMDGGVVTLATSIDNASRFTFADAQSVSELLGLLAGATSMCWQPRPTGVFDSETASAFVDGALNRLKELPG